MVKPFTILSGALMKDVGHIVNPICNYIKDCKHELTALRD